MVRLKGAGYYAVARGKQVGIVHTWADCERQVRGYPNAKFKKFLKEDEAYAYIETHRIRDGAPSYSMNPSSSLSSPYGGMHQQQQLLQQQQQNAPQDAHDNLAGFDNMAATALMSLFARPSTSSSSSSSPLYSVRKQQQQRSMSTTAAAPAAAATTVANGGSVNPRKRSHTKMEKSETDNYNAAKRARIWSSISFADAEIVYTDGACSKNGRMNAKAGWGVWWGDGSPDNSCGPVSGEQTNNRAELMAVIKAINTARSRGLSKVIIRTDSQFLISSMDKWIVKWRSNGWKTAEGKDVKNQDLLQILDAQLEAYPVHFEHVPGHAGVHGNEMADQLARHAVQEVAAGRMVPPPLL